MKTMKKLKKAWKESDTLLSLRDWAKEMAKQGLEEAVKWAENKSKR